MLTGALLPARPIVAHVPSPFEMVPSASKVQSCRSSVLLHGTNSIDWFAPPGAVSRAVAHCVSNAMRVSAVVDVTVSAVRSAEEALAVPHGITTTWWLNGATSEVGPAQSVVSGVTGVSGTGAWGARVAYSRSGGGG
jgi:hypothetical protein